MRNRYGVSRGRRRAQTPGWEPFELFDAFLREATRRGQEAGGRTSVGVFPAVNLYDDGESFMLRAELPGVAKEDLEISAKNHKELVIRGRRRREEVGGGASFHRRERSAGQFARVFTTPEPFEVDKVSASFEAGVLEVRLPREAQARPRRIELS